MNETKSFAVQTLAMPCFTAQQSRRRREFVVHDLATAEQVLDWLERKGRTDSQLDIAGKSFILRWR